MLASLASVVDGIEVVICGDGGKDNVIVVVTGIVLTSQVDPYHWSARTHVFGVFFITGAGRTNRWTNRRADLLAEMRCCIKKV